MQQINILLRRNEGEQALSVEINGKVYEPVDIEIVKELVKQAVVEA
jgi:DNA-binding protein YbaB